MNIPKITVLMSVYNSEKFLREAMDSILNQSFKDFEFLIINDGSTDKTAKILQSFHDPRINIINNKVNIGLTKSLNKGLKIAKGEYIARQDADDVSVSNRLDKQYNYLEKHRQIFLVGSGAYNIDEKGKIETIWNPLTSSELIKKTLYKNNCIYHPTIMFRNEENIFYREKFIYTQDYDFYLILLSKGKKLNNIKEPIIKYRINPEGISWVNKTKQKLFEIKAKEFYHQRLKYGKDKYDSFDPNEILSIDVERSTDKIVLETEIDASIQINNQKRIRKLCKIYFKYYGLINKFLFYYLLSFSKYGICVSRTKNILRKLLFFT